MAKTDRLSGDGTIPRGATVPFDFWWPGGHAPEYFDVSIAPIEGRDPFGGIVADEVILHLRETGREMFRIFDRDKNQLRFVLRLTIKNEEPDLDVKFAANHVRVFD